MAARQAAAQGAARLRTAREQLGAPVFYVFKLTRDANSVTWTPHLVDFEVGLGRQFTAGDLNADGKIDTAVASKHGVLLFFQG